MSRTGQPASEALLRTFKVVLVPLVSSTVVIGIGFSILLLSQFVFVSNLGFLVASVMVICLLADVALLPALLSIRGAWEKPT